MLEVQAEVAGVHQERYELSGNKRLLEEARSRAAEERDLSATTRNAHYAAASLGQIPYVSVPGMGVVALLKGSWSC